MNTATQAELPKVDSTVENPEVEISFKMPGLDGIGDWLLFKPSAKSTDWRIITNSGQPIECSKEEAASIMFLAIAEEASVKALTQWLYERAEKVMAKISNKQDRMIP